MNPYDKQDDRRLGDRIEQMNKELRAFGRTRAKVLRQSAKTQLAYTIAKMKLSGRSEVERYKRNLEKSRVGRDNLVETISSQLRTIKLMPVKLSFRLTREGIFLAHGVGRGRPIRSAAANKNKRNWLYPIMDETVNQLADLLSENYADLAADEIRILIPGIIDSRLRGGKRLPEYIDTTVGGENVRILIDPSFF